MKCPKCGGDSEVLSTRLLISTNSVTRRRHCLARGCGVRFTTHEAIRWADSAAASRSSGSSQLRVDGHASRVAGRSGTCDAPIAAVAR